MSDIAKQYIDAGWQVVPVNAGAKRASTSWQRKVYKPSDFKPDDNIAAKCGEPSGWRVDVDCDALEAVAAAKLLLPNTGLIHGRPGKPDSHYWFICQGIKTTQFVDVKDSSGKTQMIVEVRSSGGYTVVPPSVHPSGDTLTWSLERDPLVLDEKAMYEAARNVAIAALLARHWPGSGARHGMIGPLTGFLLQAGVDAGSTLELIKAASEIAGDSDLQDRVKFARTTIAKFKGGDLVTGGPRLADVIGSDVVAKMRGWLKLKDLDALEDMNTKHFFVRLGVKAVIGREDDPSGTIFQPVRELYPEYANKFVQDGTTKDGDPILKPIFEAWLKCTTRRSYARVVFAPPPLRSAEDEYNLWKGFAVEPAPGDCSKFLEHLHTNICRGNQEHFVYLTKFCAYALQHPGSPAGVAVVMRGKQGTGKGTVLRMFERILGPRHYAHLDRSEELVKWNSLVSGKVVVFADEAFFAGDKENIGALKRIITEPTIRVARKHLDSTEEANCIHLFMATNEEWAVPAGIGERRFFCLNVSDVNEQNAEFFDAVYAEIEAGGAAAFLWDMMQIPVSPAEIRAVPKTDELRHQQDQSLPMHLQWLQECLYDARIAGAAWRYEWVSVGRIYDHYETWVRRHTNRFLVKTEFGKQVQRFLTDQAPQVRRINGNAERCVLLRDLVTARNAFDKELHTRSEWGDAPGASQTIPF
jgi:hypothetical protein